MPCMNELPKDFYNHMVALYMKDPVLQPCMLSRCSLGSCHYARVGKAPNSTSKKMISHYLDNHLPFLNATYTYKNVGS